MKYSLYICGVKVISDLKHKILTKLKLKTMTLNAKVDGKDVTITLTKEQLAEIAKQTSNIKTVDCINSLEDAEEILKGCKNHIRYIESQFVRKKDWFAYVLETIIKAANFLDNNNQEWIADFNDRQTPKYINWFEKTSNGWVLYCVDDFHYNSCCPAWLYFKQNDSARKIFNKFSKEYNIYMGG